MSNQKDQESDCNLKDGKYLNKSELKNRLRKMDMDLDAKEHKKEYYSDLYNKLVQQYDRRIKIKSILDDDIIEEGGKSLEIKRNRTHSWEIDVHK